MFLLLLLVFASYRIWRLLAWDVILAKPRNRALKAQGSVNMSTFEESWKYGRPKVAEFLQCAFCSGAWISAAVVGVTDYFGSVPLPALMWLATSALVGLIERID